MKSITPARYQRIKEIFNAVCDCDVSQRARLLQERCGADTELLAEVEGLLNAQEHGNAYLAQPVVGGGVLGDGLASPMGPPTDESTLPDRIGGFRIIRLLGEGGMGSVFEAEQETPKRRVALKIIRPSAMSPKLMRRFEHEVHMLGRLQHAGIAQIFEAGRADHRRGAVSFFAMELVDGRPLIEYADANGLDPTARLELFVKICDAVQHAHHRGVIHRDLKPANIMVDDAGRPKVLDFGIARATDSDIQAATMQTDVGQLIGTIPYMSPEQVAGDPDELDTRCDVYALGVVLYELLCGRLPLDVSRMPILDAVRTIREEEPTRISSISKVFRGDMETILLKALEKDREQRYQAVSELAADIRRFLKEEPIGARPPSVSYQMRKFARRNKAIVAGVVVAIAGMALGTGAAVWNALEANTERDRAIRETRKAEQINAFLQRIINSADPQISDSGVTVREAVDRAAGALESELADEPEVRATLHHRVGQIYHRLGRYEEAERHIRTALTARRELFGDDREATVMLTDLAWALMERGDFDGAEAAFEQVLANLRRRLGDEHADSAVMLAYLADSKNAKREWSAAAVLARDSLVRLERLLGSEHENVAYARTTLAHSLTGLGKSTEAERLYRRALATQRKLLGPDHLQVSFTLTGLANCLSSQGRTDEAALLHEQAKGIRQRRVGE